MNATELVLNIAVNMERLSKWSFEGNTKRVQQFLEQTDSYIKILDNMPKKEGFLKTFEMFKKRFKKLRNKKEFDYTWSEDALTWANILTHRAKLA